MSIPKKHHYVPQFLLKNFSNEQGEFWCYNKKAPKLGIHLTRPEKSFYRKDYYTIETASEKDYSKELLFSSIESSTKPIIDKIISSAHANRLPNLSTEERQIFNRFLFLQWKRTPDGLASRYSDTELEESLDAHLMYFSQKFRTLTDEEKDIVRSPEARKRIIHASRVIAIADQGDFIQDVLKITDMVIARIDKRNKSFVVGSNAVVKLTPPGETRIGMNGVEIWMPISPEVAVCIASGAGNEGLVMLNENESIRVLNSIIFRSSEIVASRSKMLLESLQNSR